MRQAEFSEEEIFQEPPLVKRVSLTFRGRNKMILFQLEGSATILEEGVPCVDRRSRHFEQELR